MRAKVRRPRDVMMQEVTLAAQDTTANSSGSGSEAQQVRHRPPSPPSPPDLLADKEMGDDGNPKEATKGGVDEKITMGASDGGAGGLESMARLQSGGVNRNSFFGCRDGAIETAVRQCMKTLLQPDDGEVKGVWLLVSVNHWNFEQERLIILTSQAVYRVKYDFLKLTVVKHVRIRVLELKKIVKGMFAFPENSVTPVISSNLLDTLGVRIFTSVEEPSWWQSWNPMSSQLPYSTYTNHANFKEDRSDVFSVEHFFTALRAQLGELGVTIQVDEGESIMLESYVGLPSALHNQTELGLYKERGGLSF